MLKMDVKGFEWDIIKDEIIKGKENDLPKQFLFELHTEGANPQYVPSNLVAGKRRLEVAKLFLDLFHRGYRVTNKYRY
jgi:hypothetical protein